MSYHFEASVVQAAPDKVRSHLRASDEHAGIVVLPLRDAWSVLFLAADFDPARAIDELAEYSRALAEQGLLVATIQWDDRIGNRKAAIYNSRKSRPRHTSIKEGFSHVGLPRDTPISDLISIVCHGADATPFDSLPLAQRAKRLSRALQRIEDRL